MSRSVTVLTHTRPQQVAEALGMLIASARDATGGVVLNARKVSSACSFQSSTTSAANSSRAINVSKASRRVRRWICSGEGSSWASMSDRAAPSMNSVTM